MSVAKLILSLHEKGFDLSWMYPRRLPPGMYSETIYDIHNQRLKEEMICALRRHAYWAEGRGINR